MVTEMTPIVAGIVCGLCGMRIENSPDADHMMDLHWASHSPWSRFRYWLRAPDVRIGSWRISGDYTGIILFHYEKARTHPRMVWSWIWHRRRIKVQ